MFFLIGPLDCYLRINLTLLMTQKADCGEDLSGIHWIDDIHILLDIIDFCHASTFAIDTIEYLTQDFIISEKFHFWRVLFRQYFPDGALPHKADVTNIVSRF